MTTIEEAVAAAYAARQTGPAPEVIVVKPEKDSPLEALLCMYEMRKSAHDASDEQWDEFKSALVGALRDYEPDENVKVYDIPATRMWPAVAVSWRPGREYLPTELIKQHIPQVWKAFKQNSKGYWDIRKKGKR